MKVPEKLLHARTRKVLIELTTRCNLRCVYCAVTHPDYVNRDLELDLGQIVDSVASLRPHEVQMSGHGESTIVKGWAQMARDLVERGCPLSITTNLAKRLNDDEVDVLSEFALITVSCDSADPEVFAELRHGGKLEKVEENLRRIFEACERHPERRPYVGINCVLSDKNVEGLPDLVAWAADRGCASVSLTHLVIHDALIENAPAHPGTVDGAAESVERSRRLAEERGIDFNVMGGLADAIGWS